MRRHCLLVALFGLILTSGTSAGIFKKSPKPNPKDRVAELIIVVKTDKDESKRSAAASELRDYDPEAFPEIVPILIDVLMNDAKPSVRAEAAQSIGKLRPVTQEAGWALERALDKDTSMRVRMQARSSLLQYHWAGYRPPKDGPVMDTREAKEPPPPPPQPRILPAQNPPRIVPVPAPNRGQVLTPTEPPLLEPTPQPPAREGPSLEPPA